MNLVIPLNDLENLSAPRSHLWQGLPARRTTADAK